jgi:DNA-binding NtrC family response regulator
MERPLALVVDRDPAVRQSIQLGFGRHDVVAMGVASSDEAMELLRTRPVRFLVLDLHAPGVVALDLIRHAARLQPAPVVVPLATATDRDSLPGLVEAGAFDVLDRSFDESTLQLMLRKVLRQHATLEETRQLREDLQSREGYHGIVGRTPAMERVREQLEQLSTSDVPVWLWGEIGTGKKLVARALHSRSKRAARSFSVVACSGLTAQNWGSYLGLDANGNVVPESLLARLGGGTVYLEELPALAPDLQWKVLRALARRDPAAGGPDVRVLASSTIDPQRLLQQGGVREDTFALVGGNPLELVPLRDRVQDVSLLSRYFIGTICTMNHLPPIRLELEALLLLERHHWRENVEGLRNALEQAVILSADGKIGPRDLPEWLRSPAGGPAGPSHRGKASALRRFREAKREVVEAFEHSYLSELMEHHGGNVTAASQQAGMLRSALQRLLRKYGLKSAAFRRSRQPTTAGEATRQESRAGD